MLFSHSRCSFLKELLIIYSFLAALGLQCCAWLSVAVASRVLAGCDTWAPHLAGFSSCAVQASVGVLEGSVAVAPGPWSARAWELWRKT